MRYLQLCRTHKKLEILYKSVVSARGLTIFNVILTVLFFCLQPVGGVKEHNSEFWGDEPFRGVICTVKGTRDKNTQQLGEIFPLHCVQLHLWLQ